MVRFAFTEIILRLLTKSLIFGMTLTYFHTVMAPLKFLKWIHLNPLNAELNPICHLLALLGGATIVVVSRLRVNTTTFLRII